MSLDIPSPLGLIPMNVIEAAGCGILNQILKMMVPRFLAQVINLNHSKLLYFNRVKLFIRNVMGNKLYLRANYTKLNEQTKT